MKVVKIGWICDWNPLSGEGSGAELTEKAVIEEGIKRGYDITLALPNTPALNDVFKADLVVVGNASRFPRAFLAKIVERCELVNLLHDMFPICHYRAFFPDLDKCKTTCPNLNFAKKLLLNSSLNIFLSPLHYRVWCRVIPELKNIDHYLHVPTVKMDPIDGVQRAPNSVIGINVLWTFKGVENVLAYAKKHPELTFTFYGGTDNPQILSKLPKNCVAMGRVAQEEMAGIYSQAQAFIHLPSHVMAAERTAIEAKLCKVPTLILNKLVGVTSYKQFRDLNRDEFADWISKSPVRFWKKIEERVL